MFERMRKRREARQKNLFNRIDKFQESRKNIIKERTNLIKEIKKPREKRKASPTLYKTMDGFSPLPRLGFCPLYQRNIELESAEGNEPFGWKRGTVRGILTIWVTLTTCILIMSILLTRIYILAFRMRILELWFVIAGLVIGSYFYSRMRMGRGFF